MRRISLLGLVVVVTTAVVAPPARATHTDSGYFMLTRAGQVFAFGGATDLGEPGLLGGEAVDIEATPSGHGYWIITEDSTFNYGDAPDLREFLVLQNGEKVVSISATPSGKGYWLFTDRGRVFPRGDAKPFGDMGGVTLNGPVLDSVASPSGNGYWMVASDGGVFSFGDAKFYGSMGAHRLNEPVMGLAPDPDGVGYWLVASDGGIFSFEATFYGSMGNVRLNKPVSAMVGQPGGYLMVAEDGGIFTFGEVAFHGSLGANPPVSPVVSVAAVPVPGPPPVYEWQHIFGPFTGTGEQASPPFELTAGETARLNWSCIDTGTYSFGCGFRVINYETGDWLETISPDPGSGSLVLHPDVSARYYILANEFGDGTTWSATIEAERCVANC